MTDQRNHHQQPHEWTIPLPAERDRTAELPAPAASFWADPHVVLDDGKPRHEKPRNRRRVVPGVLLLGVSAAAVAALVSAVDPLGEAQLTFPTPTAQPAPKPRPTVTRTVRVAVPAVTVQAAPRPAQTVTVTKTATVTRTAKPKPAVTVTKTVTAEPAPEVPSE